VYAEDDGVAREDRGRHVRTKTSPDDVVREIVFADERDEPAPVLPALVIIADDLQQFGVSGSISARLGQASAWALGMAEMALADLYSRRRFTHARPPWSRHRLEFLKPSQ